MTNFADIINNRKKYNKIENLSKMVEEVGSSLRPPMHWNVNVYGVDSYSLTVYFERSGSMVPYDQTSGGGQLKKAVNDLYQLFPHTKLRNCGAFLLVISTIYRLYV